uniref:Uncharacterized protein n=1 Tax=Anguilla anguilla TaxID=7936 RepID=A0A0E9XYG8_ANGAN
MLVVLSVRCLFLLFLLSKTGDFRVLTLENHY